MERSLALKILELLACLFTPPLCVFELEEFAHGHI
jgi:hypothetical protein